MSTSLCLDDTIENARAVLGWDTRHADRTAVRMNSGAIVLAIAAVVVVKQWQRDKAC